MDDSEKISRLLLELQMDAESLGKSLGKSGGDIIRNVLLKRNNLSVKLASAISKKHKVSYKWLRTGEGEIFETGKEEKENAGLNKKINHSDCAVCEEKERIIKILESQISELNDRIAEQKELIKYQNKYLGDLKKSEALGPAERGTGSE